MERSLRSVYPLPSNRCRCLVFGIFTESMGLSAQEDRLWIADPKAINHILQKPGHLYAKPDDGRERAALLAGQGILWAEGRLPTVPSPSLLA